jgi:type I restriction enzyme S subunit
MPRADPTQLSNIKLSWPPKKEQGQIVNYLDKHTPLIDITIKKIEKNIRLLEEYKKSIIHHVVTGKVDARGVAT